MCPSCAMDCRGQHGPAAWVRSSSSTPLTCCNGTGGRCAGASRQPAPSPGPGRSRPARLEITPDNAIGTVVTDWARAALLGAVAVHARGTGHAAVRISHVVPPVITHNPRAVRFGWRLRAHTSRGCAQVIIRSAPQGLGVVLRRQHHDGRQQHSDAAHTSPCAKISDDHSLSGLTSLLSCLAPEVSP